MENTIAALMELARDASMGEAGERRARELEAFLREMLPEYAAALGVAQAELLAALEYSRGARTIGYYRRSNFPGLDSVTLLGNMREFKKRYPSGRFRCPFCGGVTTHPTQCNSGLEIAAGEVRRTCDGKAYRADPGAGQAMRVAFREGFLERPGVIEVFMPLEAEGPDHGSPPAWPT
jgi:hypothetical protein